MVSTMTPAEACAGPVRVRCELKLPWIEPYEPRSLSQFKSPTLILEPRVLQAQAYLGPPCFSLLPDPAAARCFTVASARQLHAAVLGLNDHSFDLTNLVQPVRMLFPCC